MPTLASGLPQIFRSGSRAADWSNYAAVREDDSGDDVDENELKAATPSPRRGRYPIVMVAIMITIALLGVLAGWLVAGRPSNALSLSLQEPVIEKPCGETPEEARALGCYFDVISFCWLPERCYDAELSDRFDHQTQWEWFMDPNRTEPLTHQQIMTGEHTGLYVNWEYHLLHCTTMWEKMHRALMGPHGKKAIDGYIASYSHTQHCGHMLLSDRDVQLDVINTIILVKYPDCGMV
ncbi:putative Major facilitator superfamily transporter [Seiridium unicorne]|uniref:Major facilitator superfamily transporter n=1 Tax=Seiridium unicorne TaxID=138068 RepID=A0ABR2VDD7_9PEZI